MKTTTVTCAVVPLDRFLKSHLRVFFCRANQLLGGSSHTHTQRSDPLNSLFLYTQTSLRHIIERHNETITKFVSNYFNNDIIINNN